MKKFEKGRKFSAFFIAAAMIGAMLPSLSIAAETSEYTQQVKYNGILYNATDNLIYNGDMSITTTDDDEYISVCGWTGGYVDEALMPLSTRPYAYEVGATAADEDSHFTYTEATEDSSAYITTMPTHYSTGYEFNPADTYCYSTVNNWFVDEDGEYVKAEAGKTYYMSFKMKASAAGSAYNYVSMGAFSGEPSSYESVLPGRFDVSPFVSTSVLDDWIKPAVYTTDAEEWVSVEAVGTASADGYFAFQNTWSWDYETESFTDFELYLVEEAEHKTVTATYVDENGNVLTTKALTYYTDEASGADFPEYIYCGGEVWQAQDASSLFLSEDGKIVAAQLDRYLSSELEGQSSFTYDDVTYIPADGAAAFENVIVNADFITADTSAWTSRVGDGDGEITDAQFSEVDGVDGNVMTISAYGDNASNSIGTAWRVESGATYYMSFYAGGNQPDSANTGYNIVADAYQLNSDGNREVASSNTLFYYGAGMTEGEWTRFENVFIAATDTVYFQCSWVDDISLGAFELVKVERETSEYSLFPSTPEESEFVHPGVLCSIEDLQRAAENAENEQSPWLEGYSLLCQNSYCQTNWTPRVLETVIRGGDGQNYAQFYIDLHRAYQCALRYRIDGSEEFGKKAVQILNSWSSYLKTVWGNADRYLASGIYGYQLAAASELVRDREDFNLEQMQLVLLNVFYDPLCRYFLFGNDNSGRWNGNCAGHYWANWDLCNMAATVAIGIFCDRRDIYDLGVEYFKYGQGRGSIYNAIPYIFTQDDGTVLGQWQESGRDQAHTQLGIGLMASLCEMAWNQGDDLYGWADNRFMYAVEYTAKYLNGDEVPYEEYVRWSGWWEWRNRDVYSSISATTTERRPIWAMIYNHYVNRKGLSMPNTLALMEDMGAEDGAYSTGAASAHDQPGFGTLLYTREREIVESSLDSPNNIADGYYKITNVNSQKLLTNEGGSVYQSEDRGIGNQIWLVTHIGSGHYTIQATDTGLYLQIEDGSYSDGALVVTDEYSGDYSQKFAFLPVLDTDGYYRITAVHTNKAVEIISAGTQNNASVIQYPYVESLGATWTLEAVDYDEDAYIQSTPTLIHHYEFNTENGSDPVDSVTGETLALDASASVYNQKLLLNGGSLALQENLFNENQTEFTIAAFMNSTAYAYYRGLFAIGSDENNYIMYLADYGDGSSVLEFMGANSDIEKTAVSGEYAPAGQWRHVAVTFEDLGDERRISLYEDGVYMSYTTTSAELSAFTGAVNYIGKSHYSDIYDWVEPFMGYVDDFRIYDSALGDSDIALLAKDRPDEDADFAVSVKGAYLAAAGENSDGVEEDTLFLKYIIDYGELAPLSNRFCVKVLYNHPDDGRVEDSTTEYSAADLTDGEITVGVIPLDTNIPYGIQVWGSVSNTSETYSDALGYCEGSEAVLYALVLKDLANSGYSGSSEQNSVRIANANTVIARGGFYTGDISEDIRDYIMTITIDDDGIITAKINQDLFDFGIGFVVDDDGIWVGEAQSGSTDETDETDNTDDTDETGDASGGWYQADGENGVIYQILTVDTASLTAALSNSDSSESISVDADEEEIAALSLSLTN